LFLNAFLYLCYKSCSETALAEGVLGDQESPASQWPPAMRALLPRHPFRERLWPGPAGAGRRVA